MTQSKHHRGRRLGHQMRVGASGFCFGLVMALIAHSQGLLVPAPAAASLEISQKQ